ncbi:MAG: alpha-L-rhamnosidase, partial [Herbinix sp.]|nr:alpha-L-rhamnosidase [Herbinix sp.]
MLNISRLTVENLAEGCVTDQKHPRFSFCLNSDRQNVTLRKAVISVGDWRLETKEQIAIPYTGTELKPFTRYTVKIEVTDDAGETAQASVTFETGRMDIGWKANWITDGSYHFTESKVSPKTMTFRKEITCKKEIKSARLYTTALGIYLLMLNGEKVGKDYFAPGFTSYKHQLQYQTYDVTQQLKKENELIAVVGGGWAVGSFTYKRRNRVYAKRQALLSELRIVYTDGTQETIGTDGSWQVTEDGNYKDTEFYNGEIYDATIDSKQIAWRAASLEKVKLEPEITAEYGSPVRAREVFLPISSFRAKSGMTIYDFGQNFAGLIQANITGTKGQRIVFKHAEILMEGELYTEPLRTAKQEAVYICKDG